MRLLIGTLLLVLAGAHGPAEGAEIAFRAANSAGGEMLITRSLLPDRIYVTWDGTSVL